VNDWGAYRARFNNFECEPPACVDSKYPCPVHAERALEGYSRLLWIMLACASDCAKYEITPNVALHFGPGGYSCAKKLNKNNDQVGRETLQLFKLSLSMFV
jgi:hypothetical protein